MICSLAENSVTVYKEGIIYARLCQGIPTHELFVKPSTKLHGMRVSMKPDTRIFGNTNDKAKIEKLSDEFIEKLMVNTYSTDH